jgi:hypothetical protein
VADSLKTYASELADFSDLLQSAAQWKEIPAAIVEKDYYLTRALRAIAETHNGQFMLKGGTSLSKGWQLLQRFSEDIDLLVRAEAESGKTARHTGLKSYAATIDQTAGFKPTQVINSDTGVHRTTSHSYSSVATDLPGLSQTVILEAGYRGNTVAADVRQIQSMAAEYAAAHGHNQLAADLSAFQIEVQDLRRTFVEKLFAAHAAYKENFTTAGKARHYYDLHEMCKRPEIKEFVGTDAYRQCVADVRKLSQEAFGSQALPESDSFAKDAAFQPDTEGMKTLERNYKADSGLLFKGQPPITEVLKSIGDLLPKL